jgi:hypothetical protein
VANNEDGGATFTLYLQLAEEAIAARNWSEKKGVV